MLVFYMDVAKLDRDVAHVCNGCTRMLQASILNVSSAFLDIRCKCAYLEVAYVSHICCKSMFEIFQSYVAMGVFMLQLAIVFIWMLYMFHRYVASVCFKCFICFRLVLHSSVSCCKCFVFQRYVQSVMGHSLSTGRRGPARWGAADGALGVPRVLRMGRAHSHPGSQVPLTLREEGVRGKE
jgi:hypothetical protein